MAVATRLAAIQASLAEGDYHTVVRLCDRREVASLARAKAFKALAYSRSGLSADAFALCDDAMRTGGAATDEVVLDAVSSVWRAAGAGARAVAAYEAACAAAPESEALARALACTYAAGEDWRRLQSASLKLYKLTDKPLYLLWGAWAIHLMTASATATGVGVAPIAITGGGRGFALERLSAAAARPLALAETLLVRCLTALPPRAVDSEALGLLAHTLVRQGRAGDAYRALLGRFAFLERSSIEEAPAAPAAAADVASAAAGAVKGKGGKATKQGKKEEEGEEDWGEDAGGGPVTGSVVQQYPFADGYEGRGRVPSAFQPVDQLLYAAHLLTLSAAWTGQGHDTAVPAGGALGGTPAPAVSGADDASVVNVAETVCDPAGGFPVGSWAAAKAAYGELLLRIDAQDWAYHNGLAYCWAREAAEELSLALGLKGGVAPGQVASGGEGATGGMACVDALAAEVTLRRVTAPVTASGATPSGLTQLDASLLVPQAAALVSAAADSIVSSSSADESFERTRGAALAITQLQAVRCELLHRVASMSTPTVPASVITVAKSLLVEATRVFVELLAGYVASRAALACCFTDVKPFLTPFLPEVGLHHNATATNHSVDLAGFCAKDPLVLSMPFSPTADVAGSSDSSPQVPLLRLSFCVPLETTQAHFVPRLETLRSTHRPDAALNAALLIALASSHDAAAAASGTPSASAAEIVADQDADVVDTLKKGGKGAKGKGGAAKKAVVAAASVTTTKAAPASFDPKDPHGVQLALAPASHLRLQPEHLLLLHTARSRVRRYSTALQLLRFLGVFSLREGVGFGARDSSSATLDKDGGPTPTALAAAAALVAEATDAWQAGLPLHATAAAAGSDREAGDCDELILLAVHVLWEVAFAHIAAGAANAEVTSRHTRAARSLLLESIVLLEQGASQSPSVAQFPLHLLRVHGWLGSTCGIVTSWAALRVKHVLTDALSHLIERQLQRIVWSDALRDKHLDPIFDALRDSMREAPGHMVTALQGGHLSSAVDILRFKKRLHDSATVASARCIAANVGLDMSSKRGSLAEVAAHISRCIVPSSKDGGESTPLTFLDMSTDACLSLRDNAELELAVSWDAPRHVSLSELRGGVSSTNLWEPSLTKLVEGFAAAATAAAAAGASAREGREDSLAASLGYPTVASATTASLELAKTMVRVCAGGNNLAAALSPWCVGTGGGLPERLLRRASRDMQIAQRHATFTVLHLCFEQDAAARAAHALSRLEALARACGLTSSSSGGSGDTLPLLLFGDWACGGSLPYLDGGLTDTRPHQRITAASALLECLGGAVALLEAFEAASGGLDAADAVASAAARSHDRLTAGVDALVRGLTLISDEVRGVIDAARGAVSTSFTDKSIALEARCFAEATLLLHHTALATNIALAIAHRTIAPLEKRARVFVGSPTAAAVSRACGAVKSGIESSHKAFVAFAKTCGSLKSALDENGDNDEPLATSMAMITGGWSPQAPGAAWAPCVAAQVVEWAVAGVKLNKGGKGAAATASALPPITLPSGIPEGGGRARVFAVESARHTAMFDGAKLALQSVGASYTLSCDTLKAEAHERGAFLKPLLTR